MRIVVLGRRARSQILIGSALVSGVLIGFVLTHSHQPEYKFLEGARAIAVKDASVPTGSGLIHGTTTFFSFEGDWRDVYARAKAEMPGVIEREAMVGGVPARILTVPRIEDGRMRVFFPPVREVTILPQRIYLTEGGQVFTKPGSDPRWASVKISEYRQPHVLEEAVHWLRTRLDI